MSGESTEGEGGAGGKKGRGDRGDGGVRDLGSQKATPLSLDWTPGFGKFQAGSSGEVALENREGIQDSEHCLPVLRKIRIAPADCHPPHGTELLALKMPLCVNCVSVL